jgi:membrane protein implicated in regulation of membrane protease activity
MYLVAIGWMYVVVMMAAAEAMSPQGTVLGAIITFVFYGLLPVSIIIYILGAPGRGRARRKAEAAEREAARLEAEAANSGAAPDGSSLAPGGAVAPERKEV